MSEPVHSSSAAAVQRGESPEQQRLWELIAKVRAAVLACKDRRLKKVRAYTIKHLGNIKLLAASNKIASAFCLAERAYNTAYYHLKDNTSRKLHTKSEQLMPLVCSLSALKDKLEEHMYQRRKDPEAYARDALELLQLTTDPMFVFPGKVPAFENEPLRDALICFLKDPVLKLAQEVVDQSAKYKETDVTSVNKIYDKVDMICQSLCTEVYGNSYKEDYDSDTEESDDDESDDDEPGDDEPGDVETWSECLQLLAEPLPVKHQKRKRATQDASEKIKKHKPSEKW